MGLALGAASVGASLGVHSALEARQGRKAQERASLVEQRMQDVKEQRERRRSIREARIARAEVEAQTQATGTSGTSGAVSGAGQVGTQLATNLSFLDTMSTLQTQANIFRSKAASDMGKSANASAGSSLFMQGASMAGSFGGGGKSPTATKVGPGSAGLGKYRVDY